MRKSPLTRTRSMSEPFLLFAAFSLASLAAFAQETTPSPPNDPAAFLLRAAESNGLPKTGGQPWHLKVSFKLFDELGNIKDQGTAEEFYISPAKFKKISYGLRNPERTDVYGRSCWSIPADQAISRYFRESNPDELGQCGPHALCRAPLVKRGRSVMHRGEHIARGRSTCASAQHILL